MTSKGAGWLGIGGLFALAGLGVLLDGGTVRNPRRVWRPIVPDGPDRLPCGHQGPADEYGVCPMCERLQEEEDERDP
jgi:hypothetical protein